MKRRFSAIGGCAWVWSLSGKVRKELESRRFTKQAWGKIVLLRYSNFGGGEVGRTLTDHLSSVTRVYRFFSGAGVFDFSSLEIPPFSALIFIGRVAKLNNRERDSNGVRSLEEKRCSRGVCFFSGEAVTDDR